MGWAMRKAGRPDRLLALRVVLLTCFVGLNLIQSALTGFCPPSIVLSKLGWLDDDGVIHWGGKNK